MLSLLKNTLPESFKKKIWNKIDSFKIRLNGFIVPNVDVKEFIHALPNYKIAVVKQDVYPDLYCCSHQASMKERVLSSIHRSGPVALFTAFNADFHIVKTLEESRCTIWKDGGGETEISVGYMVRDGKIKKRNGEWANEYPQSKFSSYAESIDWGQYDIVISIYISIPERIIRKYPKVKWCYNLPNQGVNYYLSLQKPMEGYRFFLNEKFRTVKLNPKPKYHDIDFPYHLHYYGCFHQLLNIPVENDLHKNGVFIENRTSSGLSEQEYIQLKKLGPVRIPLEEKLENVIYKELQSKYFFSLTRGIIRSRIWGNGMIEAVACGCLSFANHAEYANKDLITPFTQINSFEEFIDKVNYLEKNPDIYKKELQKQRNLLNYLCFMRPVKELFDKKIME